MRAFVKPWGAIAPIVLLLCAGCDHDFLDCVGDDGHEDAYTRDYDLAGFDEIECRSAFRVSVKQASTFHVSVSVPACLRDRLDIDRSGSRLHVGASGGGCSGGERRITIELPSLKGIDASEACRIELEGIASVGAVALEARAASSVNGDLSATTTKLVLGSASEANLNGRTDQLDLEVREASRARLASFATRRTDARLAGASSATVRVSEWLGVTASGVSTLRYIGDPQLGRVELSGASRIERQAE
jgi:hypothetical protein